MWTWETAMAYWERAKNNGIRPGLDRMERVMALLGDPHRRLRVVHVAGTNGKGSTARMIQSVLTAAGYPTGLYTSPTVTVLTDTVTIDGKPIPRETFAALAEELAALEPRMGEDGAMTEFELTTALALLYFSRQRVSVAVLECGMGGAEDATNVCPPPLAAVLMPVALEHTRWLGNTIAEIAAVKSGICKPPCTIVTSPAQHEDALAVLFERAARQGLTVRQPNAAAATLVRAAWGETTFLYGGETYTVPLGGAFQVDNALTALETVSVLAEKGYDLPPEARQAGLRAATLPCRQEVVSRDPLIVLDGAHNPHAIAALASSIRAQSGSLTLLIGMLADKDTAACASLLSPLVTRVVCCTPPSPRALSADKLAAQFAGHPDVTAVDDVADALCAARAQAGALLIAGSFTTAGAARALLCSDDK